SRLLLFFVFSCFLFLGFSNNQLPIDKAMPSIAINDTSQLGILNSRMGSRFSLNFFSGKRGIHTGALGFDSDEFSELLVGVEQDGKLEIFRLANPLIKSNYLQNQSMQLAMTGMQLKGTSSKGLEVSVTVVSPFTPAKTLDETEAIKLQVSPFFYLLVQLKNNSETAIKGKLLVGLKKLPYNPTMEYAVWGYGYGRIANEIYYKDQTAGNAFIALESLNVKTWGFEKEAFNGLSYELNIAANAIEDVQYSYSTYYNGRVQRDNRINSDLKYYYTSFWKDIYEVKTYAKANFDKNLAASSQFENLLLRSKLSGKDKWMMALTFHADLANTFLLLDEKQRPYFYLLEGRFKHQSTVDVAHETEIVALFNPWRLKLQLQQWTNYLATERVKREPERGRKAFYQGYSAAEYGPYLMHDVGDYPYISESSDYDFGPYMAAEENTNYAMLLYWYWKISSDEEFVKQKLGFVEMLLHSLVNRDIDGNGIVDHAQGWTSFDSSKSLRIYTENTYVGLKQIAAYTMSAEMFRSLITTGNHEIGELVKMSDGEGQGFKNLLEVPNEALRLRQATFYESEAKKILATLKKAQKQYGYIPVSLDKKYADGNQMSVVLGDALMYPGFTDIKSPIIIETAKLLKATYEKAYPLSTKSYGITLTSGETPTWYSKIMVSDIVAQRWFGSKNNSVRFVYQHNVNSPYTYNDGMETESRSWIGYFYPRGVVTLGYFMNEAGFTTAKKEEFLRALTLPPNP
ncbi:MAG: glycoside hydrolase family 52 protein, partial [Paludibacter sp.]